MRYVVFKSGGKQYKASEGDILDLEVPLKNKEVTFDEVLLYGSDGDYKIGDPKVKGVSVKATVLGEVKGEKILVSKFKSKVRYRRSTGHRARFSRVKIDKIVASSSAK